MIRELKSTFVSLFWAMVALAGGLYLLPKIALALSNALSR